MADQDFFFDEETEAKPAKAAKSDKGTAKAASKPASAGSGQASNMFAQNVTMAVASLMAVCALLVGVIVGLVIPRNSSVDATFGAGATPQQQAPQLSPEQLESGQLPPGHPDLSGGAGGAATGTPNGSGTTTPTK